jgi:predicted deacylase
MTKRLFFHTLPLLLLSLSLLGPLLPTAPGANRQPASGDKGTNREITGTLAPGTRYATPYYVRDSGRPGPVVMITGGVHGDEPAGAAAAEEIRHWTISRGRIIIVPRLNILGLEARRRTMRGVESSLADLNRNFAHVGRKEPPRGVLATEVWNFVQRQKPQWLVDLHEAHSLHGTGDDTVGNLLLCCRSAELTKAQPALLEAVNGTIADARRKFAVGRAPKDSTLARAAGEHLGINSFIIETTAVDQPLDIRVEHHRRIVRALLKYLDMEPR